MHNREFVDDQRQALRQRRPSKTQLDWIDADEPAPDLLVDAGQRVRPGGPPRRLVDALDSTRLEAAGRLLPAGVADAGARRARLRRLRAERPARQSASRAATSMATTCGSSTTSARCATAIVEREARARARTARRRLRMGVEEQERQAAYRHRVRRCAAALEHDRLDWVNSPTSRRRGRLDPHHPGLRPQLRRRHHRAGPRLDPARTRCASTGLTTSTRRASRTTRDSDSPTTTCSSISRTSTRCCSRAESVAPTCT